MLRDRTFPPIPERSYRDCPTPLMGGAEEEIKRVVAETISGINVSGGNGDTTVNLFFNITISNSCGHGEATS